MTQSMAGVRPTWVFTVPLPAPVVPPEILIMNGPLRNFACTARSAVMVALQVPVPAQSPNQPRKECPLLGVAVRVTITPSLNCALHPVAAAVPAVTVQVIPAGLDVMTPSPVPVPVTVRVFSTAVTAGSRSVGWGASWQAWRRINATATVTREGSRRDERICHLERGAGIHPAA